MSREISSFWQTHLQETQFESIETASFSDSSKVLADSFDILGVHNISLQFLAVLLPGNESMFKC